MTEKSKPFAAKRYKYAGSNGAVQKYLDMVNRRRGVIKDDYMKVKLAQMGFDWLDDNYHAQSKYEPSKLRDGLFKFDRRYQFRPNRDVYNEAYAKTLSQFTKLMGSCVPFDALEVISSLKLTASAGAPYFQKKSEVLKGGYKYSSDFVEEPCVAYYRTQARKSESGEYSQKVRLVWGYPLDMTILEGKYARPVIEAFISNKTPYILGLRNFEIGARLNGIMWSPFTGTFDWSGFDTSVSPELINMAFSIVKKFFIEDSIDEKEWSRIVRYFTYTPIIMPDGRVYYGKHGGIPSGSYFTGIIGSIVNLFLIEYLCIEQGLTVFNDNFLVMGDDSVVGFHEEPNIQRMGEVALSHFGMNLSKEKQRFSKNSKDVEFLSHKWSKGRCYRDLDVTITKLVYSENSWLTEGVTPKEIRHARILNFYKDNYKAWPLIYKLLVAEGIQTDLPLITDWYRIESFYTKKDTSGEFNEPRLSHGSVALSTYI